MILVPAWRAELRRGINEQTNDSLKLKQITEKSSKLKRQKPHGGVPSRALEDMELIKHILCLCWCRNITFYNFNIIYIQPVTWKHNQTLMRSQTKKASSSTRKHPESYHENIFTQQKLQKISFRLLFPSLPTPNRLKLTEIPFQHKRVWNFVFVGFYRNVFNESH